MIQDTRYRWFCAVIHLSWRQTCARSFRQDRINQYRTAVIQLLQTAKPREETSGPVGKTKRRDFLWNCAITSESLYCIARLAHHSPGTCRHHRWLGGKILLLDCIFEMEISESPLQIPQLMIQFYHTYPTKKLGFRETWCNPHQARQAMCVWPWQYSPLQIWYLSGCQAMSPPRPARSSGISHNSTIECD